MIILAKTLKGQEFVYNPKTAMQVSKASATKICEIVNSCKFRIKPEKGETWHVYEIDKYSFAFDYAQFQRFTIRKGIVKARFE